MIALPLLITPRIKSEHSGILHDLMDGENTLCNIELISSELVSILKVRTSIEKAMEH